MSSKDNSPRNKVDQGNKFGTFGGVFTPSILTIFGVIMFMRANYVVGQAGIGQALLILLFANSITLLTSLSVAAISTNTRVEGGGTYFLISRVMGPEFGGSVGLALFCAQSLSVPFYILGFTEALVATFPAYDEYSMLINIGTASVLFIVTYVGAGWAIKVQYVILTILMLSIVSFLGGSLYRFELATFRTNFAAAYSGSLSFWSIFAVYFPAVTGIMAGINMSGDLEDPAKSIPRGTFAAVGFGALVYAFQIILCGGAFDREALITRPFETLKDNALFAGGALVVAGVFAATISSAIGSFMGAPRVLQAIARDRLFRPLLPFAAGAGRNSEPRRAIWLTFALTLGVLVLAGGGGESGKTFFNTVAAVVSMFFLLTYGTINVAAFVESFGGNPSFRPRFRFFSWAMALAGSLGCVLVSVLINSIAAAGAAAVMGSIYWYLRERALKFAFGDARRGFRFAQLRNRLYQLSRLPMHPKNWRPTMLVLSGNPNTRLELVKCATWLEGSRGILTLAEILVGEIDKLAELRKTGIRRLENFIIENDLMAYPEVVVAQDFDTALPVLLQAHGIGPLKPNLLMLGWPSDPERILPLARLLRTVARLNMSMVVHAGKAEPIPGSDLRIDLWWRGQKNGALMIILAHLMCENSTWKDARLRILREVGDEAGREPVQQAMLELIIAARVEAEAVAVVSQEPFVEVLHNHSRDAALVILGLCIPPENKETGFYENYRRLMEGMPLTLLVHSSGEADLFA